MREAESKERAERLKRRQPEIDAIQKRGLRVQRSNGGVHVRIRWLSYWPSTGKWLNERTKKRGTLRDDQPLAPLVEAEVGT